MASPLTADVLLAALRAEGLRVVEIGAWRTWNRDRKGPFGPLHGVMIHHTASSGTDSTVQMCRDGYADLPGPLCHGVIGKDGVVYLVGYGRTNHAGLGDTDVLRAVIAEQSLPPDNEASVDGNRHFYGFECTNLGDGEDPWPDAQLEAIERAAAALCRAHGWGAHSVLGHKEWQPGKPDPTFSMDTMRARIADRLGSTAPVPLPEPQRPVVDLSLLVTAARTDPGRPGSPVSYAGVRTVEVALVDEGLLAKAYLDGHFGSATKEAYSRWQERLGYRGRLPGQAADGIPARTSLVRLGDRHGFDVIN
ncbi:N-acetylmuramoyl-L-alanine amidase [Embleya sp. AB8]|uniref:N-acetylmuramoyl-L-alanine amidase n=1 Tax=Embleya sp. AB8 TaxID=3156304 RepID=UPI003C767E9B